MMKNSIRPKIIGLSALFSLFLLLQTSALAAAVVDTTFGTNGRVVTDLFIRDHSVVVQPDGKIVVAGLFGVSGAVARFNENGSLDTTFGNGGTRTLPTSGPQLYDVVLQSDGKIVVVGEVNGNEGQTNFLIARLTAQGALDTSFDGDGMAGFNQGSFDRLNAVAVQADGKIVAVGSTSDGGNRGAALRLNADGSLDTAFAAQGFFFFSFVQQPPVTTSGFLDVKVLPNGRILLGAAWSRLGQPGSRVKAHFLTMLDAAGQIDTNFGTQGFAGDERPVCCDNPEMNFEVLPGGRIFVVSGAGATIFESNGSIYKRLSSFEGYQTSLMPNGRVVVSGDSGLVAARVGSVKLYSGESLIGKATSLPNDARAFAMPNGKILVAAMDGFNLAFYRLNTITSQGTRIADFDRDDRSDPAVYQPGATTSLLRATTSRDNGDFSLTVEGNKIIPEFSEYIDANNIIVRDSILSWRRGQADAPSNSFYYEKGRSGAQVLSRAWGIAEDIPTGGDFNGDAVTDLSVFRPSNGTWYSMRGDNGNYQIVQWGAFGDKPVPADYDYDGKTDYAVYRPSTGVWWILRSSDGGSFAVRFGIASDIPVTGDFDADGRADFSVYRPTEGNWYHLLSTEGFRVVRFGLASDVPVPGDYDGDGRHDQAIYRNGQWHILQSTAGYRIVVWGQNGDLPAAVRYDQ